MWNKTNEKHIRASSEYIWTSKHLSSQIKIDAYVKYLKKFILTLINQIVFLDKNTTKHTEAKWWISEIEQMIKEIIKKVKNNVTDVTRELAIKKKKMIRNVKRAHFRSEVQKIAEDFSRMWKLIF